MPSNLNLAGRLSLNSSGWDSGLAGAQRKTRTFVDGVRNEVAGLGNFFRSTLGTLATLGAGYTIGAQLGKSAKLDKSLTQIGQTAGATRQQVRSLRGELFQMGRDTGQATDQLEEGFNSLVQSGLSWNESRATLDGINKAMVVTGANADVLAGSLGVASTAFHFDLANPGQALSLLDKMTVAGRLGNAELENLGSIFSRVGVNAKGAGFGFDQTLAFIESLSMIERQPERLATLADSTIRLFTNARYMAAAQKTSGVRFFDKKTGERRDPLQILAELKTKMDAFKTDAGREGFLSKAFGQADQDTIKGLRTLLQGDSLSKVKQFSSEISGAGGTIERDLPQAMSNAVDQAGRLRNVLTQTADTWAQKITAPFNTVTKKLLDSKQDGGLGLTGGQLLGGGAASLLGLYAGKRLLGGLLGRLVGGAGNLAGGVAMGTALEKAGAATPVFVVGAAPGVFAGGGGGLLGDAVGGGVAAKLSKGGLRGLAARLALAGGSSVGSLATAGAAGLGTAAAGVGAAGVAGYGIGTAINKNFVEGTAFGDSLGRSIAKALAFFGNENARQALAAEQKAMQLEVQVNVNDNLTTARVRSVGPNVAGVRSGASTSQTGRVMSERGGGR